MESNIRKGKYCSLLQTIKQVLHTTAPIINCDRIFPAENPRIFSMFSVRAEILSDFTTQLIIA